MFLSLLCKQKGKNELQLGKNQVLLTKYLVSKTDKNICRIENNVSLVYTLCYWLCKVKSFTIIIWYTWNQRRCQKMRMKQRILFSCTFYVDIGKITKESMSAGKSSYYIWFIMLQSFLIVNIFESFNASYSFLERNSVDLYLWCKLFLSRRRTTHTRARARVCVMMD